MFHLLKRTRRVRPASFCCRDFFLLHDNAPAHKAASVYQFLTEKNVTILYHLPYSPGLSPPDCFLFPKLKMKLKGLHFADVVEIQEAVTDELKKAKKEEISAAFQKLCICQWRLFNKKNRYVSSSCVFDLKKIKISPETFGPHCV